MRPSVLLNSFVYITIKRAVHSAVERPLVSFTASHNTAGRQPVCCIRYVIIRLIEQRPTKDDWYSLSLICCAALTPLTQQAFDVPSTRIYLWSCQMKMRVKLPEYGNGKLTQNCSLPFPTSHSYSHSHSHEIGTIIPIPMGFPWDPLEFPTFAHLYSILLLSTGHK